MSDLTFNVYISSRDSISLHPTNTPYEFVTELPFPISLPGKWTCSVEGVFGKITKPDVHPLCLHVLLDCVRTSISYGTQKQIACTCILDADDGDDEHPIHLSPIGESSVFVSRQSLSSIGVRIVTNNLEDFQHMVDETIVILKFRTESWPHPKDK